MQTLQKINNNVTKTLDETTGRVKVTETYEKDRYRGMIDGDCSFICHEQMNEIKACCKIYIPRGDYSHLSTYSVDYDELTGNLVEDLKYFQQKLDEDFDKDEYEAFVLGAYIHGATVFSINKVGNRVCQFDSSQLGFIGLKKNADDFFSAKNADKIAEELTACWEGEYKEYSVIDNLDDEIVDSVTTYDYETIQKFCDMAKQKYGIDFDTIKVTY